MKRRVFLAGATGLTLAAGGAATGGLAFRLHATPRREPFLTDAHLSALSERPQQPKRVLFVGNSFTLQHDVPGLVAQRAAAEGVALQAATAAANGARLIESLRVAPFRAVLKKGWDVLVFQGFSTMVLRAPDRWAAAYAMRQMAHDAGTSAVLLFPTWALPAAHRVYREGGGRLSATPVDRDDFARRITLFYSALAQSEGWERAPVTEALHEDINLYTGPDGHHLNTAGAERVADVLWGSLRDMIVQQA